MFGIYDLLCLEESPVTYRLRKDVDKQNNGFDFRLAVISVHICRKLESQVRTIVVMLRHCLVPRL